MIEAREFRLKDLERFNPKKKYDKLEDTMQVNLFDISKIMMSLWSGDRVIAILGVNRLRAGAGELWLLPGKEIDTMKYGFFKAVKKLIYEYCFDVLAFHRLEIAIRKDWFKGYKWAEKLGFEWQGECKGYCPDYDAVIFYKVMKKWRKVQS